MDVCWVRVVAELFRKIPTTWTSPLNPEIGQAVELQRFRQPATINDPVQWVPGLKVSGSDPR